MVIADLLDKKRQGGRLARGELEALILGYVRGTVPDYQVAAWLMAVCLQGMEADEVADLTAVMVESGRQLDLSGIGAVVADKHSTGGVGDKTSLLVVPVVAACGVPVAKMSGRGLGFTGGTLDKLESLPGLRVGLSADELVRQVSTVGAAIAGQTADLAPADGMLYALRDVTATVASIPLIASSVMSKKLAGGAQVIVLDVKRGRGAFMRTDAEATELAAAMVAIGQRAGRRVTAFVSDMDQPLGRAVGNALEIREVAEALAGRACDERLLNLTVTLATEMVALARGTDRQVAEHQARRVIEDGSAMRKLIEMVAAQGGDSTPLESPDRLASAAIQEHVSSTRAGFVAAIDALEVARAANRLGAGRERKGDPIDHAVGVEIISPVGSAVVGGQTLAIIHANRPEQAAEARQLLAGAFTIADDPPRPSPLIRARLASES